MSTLARLCREVWAEGFRRQAYPETVIVRARAVYGDLADWPTVEANIRCVAIDRGEG